MVREGAKKRMSFAFCLDQGKDPLLMIQPGKKPETLKTPMKNAGGGPPMAWGAYVVRSGAMEMICEIAPQRMVTELKKFLKRNPAKVNVLFYDDGGNLLDSLKPEAPEGQRQRKRRQVRRSVAHALLNSLTQGRPLRRPPLLPSRQPLGARRWP